MRTIALCLCFLFPCTVSPQSPSQGDDPYSLVLIRTAIDAPENIRSSWVEKRIARLGDGVSIAFLKVLEEGKLTDPSELQKDLPVIRQAFAVPQIIAVESDKKPKVTMFLLDYMRRNVHDAKSKIDIQQTIDFVKEKTARANGVSP
jgi:hypothetical protein